MTAALVQIWRHPIKAHGFEALERTAIEAGQTLPWDRVWAVRHEASKAPDDGSWASCANFTRGAGAPHLMAIAATLDEASETVTLRHPDQPELTFQPDDAQDEARFLDWVAPLMPADRAMPSGIIRAIAQGMTDSSSRSISLGNLAMLRALEQMAGQSLDTRRFRINLWVEGLAPYEELEWLEKPLRIGDVSFTVRDHPITRCTSTMANPDTGRRDADPLAVMEANWGHRDFGLTLIAETSGTVGLGDAVALV